jgi:hypothetical protein
VLVRILILILSFFLKKNEVQSFFLNYLLFYNSKGNVKWNFVKKGATLIKKEMNLDQFQPCLFNNFKDAVSKTFFRKIEEPDLGNGRRNSN